MTQNNHLLLDQVIQGDCVEILDSLPENSVDVIFADPPYNLQLRQELWRPNRTRVDAVTEEWDRFDDFQSYDRFSREWLTACRRVLKETGTIWVIGTYHNIFRLGALLQDLDFWILNDIIWIKTNPMPNFRGVRFTNAHETLIWAGKARAGRYTFNHHAMKAFNDDKQMRSDWVLPICLGVERIKVNGKKAHPTQKPQALLYRILLASTKPGDIVLDPFFGTGTTGAVAHLLHRHWIGIEREAEYVDLASRRIASLPTEPFDELVFNIGDKRRTDRRIPFGGLLEAGMIRPGQMLYFQGNRNIQARVKPDGRLRLNGQEGSIHELGRWLIDGNPCNGWDAWYYEADNGELQTIDELRKAIRAQDA